MQNLPTAPRTSATPPARLPTCWPRTGICWHKTINYLDAVQQPLIDQQDQLQDFLKKVPTALNMIGCCYRFNRDFVNFYACDITQTIYGLQAGRPVRHPGCSSSRRVGARGNENTATTQPGAESVSFFLRDAAGDRRGPKLHQCPDVRWRKLYYYGVQFTDTAADSAKVTRCASPAWTSERWRA